MLRDDDLFPPTIPSHSPEAMTSPYHGSDETHSDDHDEVYSPTARDNSLDDVWGSESETGEQTTTFNEEQHGGEGRSAADRHDRNPLVEPSDVPRLRSQHSTAGYRDGITMAKAETIQAGFDEGYSLGATIGLRAGQAIGVLEGLWAGTRAAANPNTPDETNGQAGTAEETAVARLKKLVDEARQELRLENMFGSDYWSTDGMWKYHVGPDESSTAQKPLGPTSAHPDVGQCTTAVAETDITFRDVADAHPLLKKWETIVEVEATKANVDLTYWERAEVERIDDGVRAATTASTSTPAPTVTRRPADSLDF